MTALRMFKGDDKTLEFLVNDSDGEPLDLSGYDITFEAARRRWQAPVIFKTLGNGISLGETAGSANVELDSLDTININPVGLVYRLKVIDSNDDVTTVATGRLYIE